MRSLLIPSTILLLIISHVAVANDTAWHDNALKLPGIERHGDHIRWGGSDGPILSGQDGRHWLLNSTAGSIRIHRDLINAEHSQLPAQIVALATHATGAGLEGLRVDIHPATGPRLLAQGAMVTSNGVLREMAVDSAQRQPHIAAITASADALIAALPGAADLGPHARAALIDVVRRLDQEDSGPALDEVGPAYARKVTADGFLIESLPMLAAEAAALTTVVQQATALLPTSLFRNEKASFTAYADAWGRGNEIYRSPQGVRMVTPAPLPMLHSPMQRRDGFPRARVVSELPATSDPIANPASIGDLTAAQLFHRDTLLASWSADEGFVSDLTVWRSVVPDLGLRPDQDMVRNYLPPHIVVSDGRGHIFRLITAHGSLRPAASGSREEATRFMDDAAVMLPDAAHLDLIGQYLFTYAYDSPDPTMPLLMGNKDVKSDIHQTAYETLSTTVGGVCRGDCDDLSELMEHIVERQGKLAHVISLPGHAALAWAEHENDEWHVFVLQTGPALQFTAPRLQDALRATYRSFDASETFDPNGIGLLLRFSGENTRSAWRLSYRIFSDRDYAETMIDVQKDWHYQTYLQAINKMLVLIEEGDEDTANFRELAGLYAFTAQFDKAIEYHKLAMERTEEEESVLLMALELLYHLNEAERHEELATVAQDLLDRQIPAMREELGQSIIQVGLQLAGALGGYGHAELAARTLRDTIGTSLREPAQSVARWSQQNYNDEAWRLHPQLRMIDRILSWHSGVLTSIIEADREQSGAVSEAIPEFRHFLQVDDLYRRSVAFNGSDGGDISAAYALQGQHLLARSSREELLAALDAVDLPGERINHRDRSLDEDALRQRDLQWIKASVPFWSNMVMESLRDIRENPLSPEQAQLILPQLEAAVSAAETLGLSTPRIDYQAHFARLVIALISEDQQALEALLHHVRRQNDKRLTDNTAQYMGDVAYALSSEWFTTTVEMWRDIVDHKPKYLWIAWRAAVNHAPDKALIAARISAERFPEDPAFVAEYAFMQELLGKE